MKCGNCNFWKIGIPTGVCLHKDGHYQRTNDRMVFEDASEECPLIKEKDSKYKKANSKILSSWD